MRTAFLLLVLSLVGCDASDPSASSDLTVTGQATLGVGESAVVDGVSVTFDGVEEDSRCPPDAVCVWEGVAFVALDLDGTARRVRVVDPERSPEAGVRVGGVTVFASALSFGAPARVTVTTAE